jgi:hypothetical protein
MQRAEMKLATSFERYVALTTLMKPMMTMTTMTTMTNAAEEDVCR